MKPVLLKLSASELSPEDHTAMPLEDFSGYELELQETIMQLNSELEADSDSSSSLEEDIPDQCVAENSLLVAYSSNLFSSETDSSEEEEAAVGQLQFPEEGPSAPTQEDINQGAGCGVVLPASGCAYQFDDYVSLLQKAVHELASLSDILVGMHMPYRSYWI